MFSIEERLLKRVSALEKFHFILYCERSLYM